MALHLFHDPPPCCPAPRRSPAPHPPGLLNCCCIPAEGAFEVQSGACGLSAAASVMGTEERPGQAPRSPLKPAEPRWCERHYHDKSLDCMSMLRPRRDPRTAAPGLGLEVGVQARFGGVGRTSGGRASICMRDRDTKRNKETARGHNDSILSSYHHPVGPRSPKGQARRSIPPLLVPNLHYPHPDPRRSQAHGSLLSSSGCNLAASEP